MDDGGVADEAGGKRRRTEGIPPRLRVLELFAGIGGWRLALEEALRDVCEGVTAGFDAYDSGPHCSEIYAENFGQQCSRRNIEQLGLADLEGFDVWVMSPPCQPFSTTREAKQRDLKDKRCKALEHLTGFLSQLQNPPRWLALENVKGFQGSEASEQLLAALASVGFTCRPLLLDLAHFGVPNHRTRYYLLAERSQRFAEAPPMSCGESDASRSLPRDFEVLPPGILASGSQWTQLRRAEIEEAHVAARQAGAGGPQEAVFAALRTRFVSHLRTLTGNESLVAALPADSCWKLLPLPRSQPDALLLVFEGNASTAVRFLAAVSSAPAAVKDAVTWAAVDGATASARPARRIGEFLEDTASLNEAQRAELIVSKEVLAKPFARGLSYVEPGGNQTFCFTGHYGKVMHKSSGSLLHLPEASPTGRPVFDREDAVASHGAVRFFSPKEVINLLGFPASYRLPPEMGLRHRYKVVGNSIAVVVAAELLRVLFDPSRDCAPLALLDQSRSVAAPHACATAGSWNAGATEPLGSAKAAAPESAAES